MCESYNPYDFGVAAVGSDLVIPFECPPLIVREEIFCNVTIKEKNGLYGPAPLHKPVLLGLARCSTVKNEKYLILSQVTIIWSLNHTSHRSCISCWPLSKCTKLQCCKKKIQSSLWNWITLWFHWRSWGILNNTWATNLLWIQRPKPEFWSNFWSTIS